ncbi:B-cell receptor CD22-like [Astyanax mexicanus]|uniref:B-cell receptor CD22-like n=1 Tax=Astyanax mexicanus TaxID=7994 RepID=UPI0020CAC6A6|nr:B-cell receptor CD22-like [Astyanax mexicanus]
MENQQVEGKLFSATCSIRHSCPSSLPLVEWIGLSNVSNSVITTKDQDGLWTSVFQAKFKPNLQDHEKNLSCRSTFSSQTISSEKLQINVLYAPSDVKIQAEGNSVVEGGSLSLTCSATSRPPPSRYEWSVSQMDTTEKYSGTEHRYTFKNIQRETSVSCTVFNSVGEGQSEQLKLNVHFPPKILLSPNCSEWAGGLLCVCRAEAEPKANVSWTVDGRHARFPQFNITTSYSDTVTVSELTGPLTGNVSCTASNYLSADLHHTTVLIPQSDGNSVIIATVVAVCVILGVTVVAVYLRRRRQIPQHSTSR